MAKSKHAPALFEVIKSQEQQRKQDSGRLALPKWWRSGGGEGDEPVDVEGEEAEATGVAEPEVVVADREAAVPVVEPQPAPRKPAPVLEVPATPTTPVPRAAIPISGGGAGGIDRDDDGLLEPAPWIGVRSGRLEISLTLINAVVVAGGILLALLCSYQVGARFGGPEPAVTSGEEAETPDSSLLDVGSQEGAGETNTGSDGSRAGLGPLSPAGDAARSPGLNYVLVQGFKPEHEDDAWHAQQWLAEQGVATTVERARGNRGWLLITVEGFDYSEDLAQRWEERIQNLGQLYKDAYKGKREIRYDFRAPLVQRWSRDGSK